MSLTSILAWSACALVLAALIYAAPALILDATRAFDEAEADR